MLKEGEIYFNRNTSINLKLFLEKYPSVPIANEEFEEMAVEGRNGNLYVNKGIYQDRKIQFTFTILSEEIEIDFDEVYTWLTEIQDNRLIFGREDRCYIVKKVLFGDLQKEFRNIGQFDITFICEPFKSDLESTTHEITTNNFSLEYFGTALAEPLIKIYGNEEIKLTVNGQTMQILEVSKYAEIDSKLMQVRNLDGTSKDRDTLGDFVLFTKGNNLISFTGLVTKIIIEYRTNYK